MDRLHICISMRSYHCLEKILQKSLRNGRMHFYIRSSVSYSKSKFQESGDSLPQIILFEIFYNFLAREWNGSYVGVKDGNWGWLEPLKKFKVMI